MMMYFVISELQQVNNKYIFIRGLHGSSSSFICIRCLASIQFSLYRYTRFYTAANVHSAIKQLLQIIHTSLAIENSFM